MDYSVSTKLNRLRQKKPHQIKCYFYQLILLVGDFNHVMFSLRALKDLIPDEMIQIIQYMTENSLVHILLLHL